MSLKIGTYKDGRAKVDFELEDSVVTDTLAILAKRGTGKSNTAVVLAERMWHAGHQWVAIDPKGDWYGIRASADGTGPGLPIPVFGGDHGDLPLDPNMGAFIAELIIRENITCILDVSDFDTKADQVKFLTAFGRAFHKAAKKNPAPRHLFLEEADEFLPQQVQGGKEQMPACVGVWTKIVKLGRTAGIGATLITQRSASLNKGALTQIETLIVLRTPSPQDKAAIKGWLSVDKALADEIMDSLPALANGEAWVISPHSLGLVRRVQFDRRSTFDTGSTPVAGEARPAPRLADLDLSAIKTQMAELAPELEKNDPAALRKQIKQLQHQLSARQPTQIIDEAMTTVEVPVIPPEVVAAVAELGTLVVKTEASAAELHRSANDLVVQTERDRDRVNDLTVMIRKVLDDVTIKLPPSPLVQRTTTARAPRPRPSTGAGMDPSVGKGAPAKILNVAAQFPDGVSKTKLSLMAGVPPGKSTLRNALSKLRTLGLITDLPGDLLVCTPAGIEAAGDPEPFPTGQELIDHWLGTLGGTNRDILAHLVDTYPTVATKESIGDALGIDPGLSTIRNGMSKLRGLELVTGWSANPELFA